MIERNLGEQPMAAVMAEHGLRTGDVVEASTEQITRKMVTHACKGRRLSPHVKAKIRTALSKAAGKEYTLQQLFLY